MAAPQPVAPMAADQQQQHPMPYARRKRFVEQEANIYEIMTWGSAAGPSASPARPARASTGSNSHGAESVHGMKTRSQAAAEREQEVEVEEAQAAALALLRKKQKERAAAAATAAKVKASSIALAPTAAAPILSPWATKTLQKPARRPGRKPEAAGGAGVAVVNAHRSPKALFPYPHTPGKPGSKAAAVPAAAEEQEAVRGVTRQLSDTAFAKKYQKPVFGSASPTKGKEASPPLVVVADGKTVQTRARQVWPKGVATAAAAAAPVVAVGRTPTAKGAKTPAAAKGGRATSSKKSGKKVVVSGEDEAAAAALTPRTLATVEAGYRSFVAQLEKEREALSFQQQQRRVTRASSGSAAAAGCGNVVVLASTPARKGKPAVGKGGNKTPATVGKEKEGEFVVVEHMDAPPAEVAKALAAAGVEGANSLVLDDTANSSALVGRSEEAEAALTVLKSRAAKRKGKKAYDEEDEASDEEGAALKTDPRAYRAWVEQIPPAGAKVVKGLCVADCFC